MRRLYLIVFLLLVAFPFCRGQESALISTVSPKLKQFLEQQPAASQMLTNALHEAFSARAARLYYFYSDSDSSARAFHYYPADSQVVFAVRENQQPLDEFICLIFEVLNSEEEKHFAQLCDGARSGDLSKEAFAQAVLEREFDAYKRTRDLLRKLKVTKRTSAKSYFYGRLTQSPDRFEDFARYLKKVSPERDPIREYESQYDSLRQTR